MASMNIIAVLVTFVIAYSHLINANVLPSDQTGITEKVIQQEPKEVINSDKTLLYQ